MPVHLHHGDCLSVLRTLPDDSIDSIVTDPPYGLSDHAAEDVRDCLAAWIAGREYVHPKPGFMGRTWDSWVPGPDIWREALRVLKPGGHMLAFAGTRSMDLMSMAIRLSGFELRDAIGHAKDQPGAPVLAWVHGQGLPKGLDLGKRLRKEFGADARLDGWSTALKPAWEPILLARKPLLGTAVANARAFGTGGLNIDACRLPIDPALDDPRLGGKGTWGTGAMGKHCYGAYEGVEVGSSEKGRFPANVVWSEDPDAPGNVGAIFASFGDKVSGKPGVRRKAHETHSMVGRLGITGQTETGYADGGSASRFFYCGKATKADRQGSKHVSVKPIALLRYLVRLITPPGGIVLDLFAGSGTTGQAAVEEGFDAVLIEQEDEYIADCRHRLSLFLV